MLPTLSRAWDQHGPTWDFVTNESAHGATGSKSQCQQEKEARKEHWRQQVDLSSCLGPSPQKWLSVFLSWNLLVGTKWCKFLHSGAWSWRGSSDIAPIANKYAVSSRHPGWSAGCRWSNTITEMLDASQAPGAGVRKNKIKLKWERNPSQSRVCSFRIFFLSLCPTVKK